MTRSEDEDKSDPPLPRETTALFGHDSAEREFLAVYRSGRVPHAWLIGGEPGIGKATLAFRIARFVLAHPDPSHVPTVNSLALDPAHRTVRRIAVNAHPDLLALERTPGDNGKMRTVITVEQVRRLVGFFGSTAGEGGWRVCIVDSADELKFPEGPNALLKVLEEPPQRSLFLLVGHAPGRLLPTIRSRCRHLALRPLDVEDVTKAAAAALGTEADEAELREAAKAADGSVARAIAMAGGPQLKLREQVTALLERLPATDARALHAIGDSIERGDENLYETFMDTVRNWLTAQLDRQLEPRRLAQVAEAWERLNRAADEAEEYNLERKPLVFNAFSLLAEAARG